MRRPAVERAARPPRRRRSASATTSRSGCALRTVPQAAQHDRVVVGDQDARIERGRHRHGSSRGCASMTSVPPPGRGRDRELAPISIARSRMPRMPCDDGCAPARARGRRRRTVSTTASPASRRARRSTRWRRRGGRRWSAPPGRRGRRRAPARSESGSSRLDAPLDADAAPARRTRRSAGSALCSPRSSSASGRSRRAIRRTSSVPLRAVSRSSSSCVAQLVGDVGGEAFDLEHHAGERLADLVVQLARDPPPLGLLHQQRQPRALAALGLEPVEHLVERCRQRADVSIGVRDGHRRPGPSGSMPASSG